MPKGYKTLAFCRMCKKKYEVKDKSNFRSAYYCDECRKKYFKNEEK